MPPYPPVAFSKLRVLSSSILVPSFIIYMFSMMGYDKKQAKRGNWRIPERRLLTIGLVGGGLGGLMGQKKFHHKTQKPVFALCYSIGVIAMISCIYLTFK